MQDIQDRIIRTDYSDLMQKNYIDYAMSVIVARALPDVRDRKSARIVGDTMGKYHPHGDSSIYDSLVVMAQDFKKGQVLVDGHGNFGSIEGDGAAAMRYTEARLMKITEEVYLADLDKDIVNFVPNFDENEKEPEVLPVRIPNILVNGSEGIAVGMATSIPPHNLGEVVDAASALIKDPDVTEEELFSLIKGPDFPTGGLVVNADELPAIYASGQGKIRLRGRVEIEKLKGGKEQIVVTEIPYTMIGAGIGKFMSDVAALAESRVITDIADISNQSSKEGIRIVIELKKGADTDNILNILYKKTKLEDTFGVNMLVVSEGRPETMSLKALLESFVEFRIDLANRKYQTLLTRDLEKKEVEEGLIRACDVIDLIIEILRGSKNAQMARDCMTLGITDGIKFKTKKSEKLASQLHFTERQAQAILDMRLVKLIGLEVEALIKQHEETLKRIAHYEKLLGDYDAMAEDILDDLRAVKKEFTRPRRTTIINAQAVVIEEKQAEPEEVVFALDRFGYVKALDPAVYEKNRETADGENRYVFRIMNTDKVCIFTEEGKLHSVKMADVPVRKLKEKGIPIDNLSNFTNRDETIAFVCPQSALPDKKIFFATSMGNVKITAGEEFVSTVRTIQATKLSDGDRIISCGFADGAESCVLMTAEGFNLRFLLAEIPEMKKAAAGVRGIKLSDGDEVTAAYLLAASKDFSVDYKGKKLTLNRLKLAKRAGKGTKSR